MELNTYSHVTTVPKFNISGIDTAELKNSIEHSFFVDGGVDMAKYTALSPIIDKIVAQCVMASDRAFASYQRNILSDITESVRCNIAEIVFGHKQATSREVRHDTVVDDDRIVYSQTVELTAPFPTKEVSINDW